MKVVHFGPGNIGRGFIGSLLIQEGHEVTFIGVNEDLDKALNEQNTYDVEILDDEPKIIQVDHFKSINSRTNSNQAIEAIGQADLITTAIGPSNLKSVSSLIAKGLLENINNPRYIHVIACENMLNGSQTLKQEVLSHCSTQEREWLEQWVGFPNAVIDRIVPSEKSKESLTVKVEPYFEWVIDKGGLKGDLEIPHVKIEERLTPFIFRKLYTVNTAHAIAAYAGYQMGMENIDEAIKHRDIRMLIRKCLEECGQLMTRKHGFHPLIQAQYIEETLKRFSNPHFIDPVARVARSPQRKLGPEDRLLGPALYLFEEQLKEPRHLIKACAIALSYNHPDDKEAMEIQENIHNHGVTQTFADIAKLPHSHQLVREVSEQYDQLQTKGISSFLKSRHLPPPQRGYFPVITRSKGKDERDM
ncbi:D-mannitol 1-phosphate 5-dehydrogenase [Seinonella peptonophila]|uniref:Mannitol-1-phosphate 5-dehydrogenase n=1 Tax=Seinonella peptonophila TaxID=112248 RepID=A0A1M4WNF8_9BACL|nr:mannitol-1-phosphate 5-dehydrogenase [Seinonella peptonophila]SHE82776.1 D-mannitol 1-phosphate 5-dehydrogenase [Seinonella peptonophila]